MMIRAAVLVVTAIVVGVAVRTAQNVPELTGAIAALAASLLATGLYIAWWIGRPREDEE